MPTLILIGLGGFGLCATAAVVVEYYGHHFAGLLRR